MTFEKAKLALDQVVQDNVGQSYFKAIDKSVCVFKKNNPTHYEYEVTLHLFNTSINCLVLASTLRSLDTKEAAHRLKYFFELVKFYLEIPFTELPLLLPVKSTNGIPEVLVFGRLKAGV